MHSRKHWLTCSGGPYSWLELVLQVFFPCLCQSNHPADGQHLRGADAPQAAPFERDGGVPAAAALVVVAFHVGVGCAAVLTVGVIGPGAAAPVAIGVLRAGAVAELAVALVLVGAGEAGAVPLRGEDELATQTGEEPRAASLPGAAWRTHTHSRLHDSGILGTRPPELGQLPLPDS